MGPACDLVAREPRAPLIPRLLEGDSRFKFEVKITMEMLY
jgi:hypothetical protein